MPELEHANLPALPGILETVLYATDLSAAKRFYEKVMRLPFFSEQPGRSIFFRCGEGMLLIFNPDNTSTIPVPIGKQTIPMHGARGEGHIAFRVAPEDLDRWQAHLTAEGIEIESRISWRPNVESLYFRDPAGNSIELAVQQLWFTPRG